MTEVRHAAFLDDGTPFRQAAPTSRRQRAAEPYWLDTATESVLRDVDDAPLLKVRPLAAGGVSARWVNGHLWDLSDLGLKGPQFGKVRWFATLRDAKAGAELLLP